MTVVIGCDSFLSLRNVRNGDLGHRLGERGERVVVLVDPQQVEGSLEQAPREVEIRCLLPFDARRDPALEPLMTRAYLARKAAYDPLTLWSRLRASSTNNHRGRPLRRLASLAAARARLAYYRAAGRRGRAEEWRREFARALHQHPITAQYAHLLAEVEAEAVVAFSLEGPREMALVEAARQIGLPTAVLIRSRDNLSAKIDHMPDADLYFVWAEVTREFLLYMYPEIAPERVRVTGSPQFDHHLDPACRLPRAEFFARIGLDPARPLVVYTCATPTLIPHEIDIVQHLADAVGAGTLARGAQLLVRGHPRGFGSNFPLLRRAVPGVAVYPPPGEFAYKSPEHEAQVVKRILEDEPMHLATLAYQDVQVNVSGTMLVDSAILDKPCVAVYYDLPPDVPEALSVRRFYLRSDMRPIVESGGVRLARSPEECLAWINRYLDDPTLDAAGRRRIRETEAGPLDGRAGERIAAGLLDLVPQRQKVRLR